MKPGESIHLGDGAYLHFSGYDVELRANHHEHPTDRVCVDLTDVPKLIGYLQAVMKSQTAESPTDWIRWFDSQNEGDQRTMAIGAIEELLRTRTVCFSDDDEERCLYWEANGEDLRIPF